MLENKKPLKRQPECETWYHNLPSNTHHCNTIGLAGLWCHDTQRQVLHHCNDIVRETVAGTENSARVCPAVE